MSGPGEGVVRLATRGSRLALAQAELAAAALAERAGASTETVTVRTHGDREQTTPVSQMEGQGWFTAEIERALLDGRADAAVHSAKDLPSILADGLVIAAHLPRADARDALVAGDGVTLDRLPAGARVGTSSARRVNLLRALRPDVRAVPMRGNVDTRLRKLDDGEVDALLLACAGLDRLGLGDRISERLDPRVFVPAPAQGAIALETRAGDPAEDVCRRAADAATAVAVAAERAVLVALGGGCLIPLGAWARTEGDRLVLSAAIVDEAGRREAEMGGDPSAPEALGEAVAERLR